MADTKTATASWGVTAEKPSGVTGVLVEFNEDSEPVLGTEQNEKGAVIGQARYDERFTASLTVQVPADADPPDPGDTVSIGGKDYYVKSAGVAESNTAYRRIRITAERYRECGQTNKV